LALDAATVMVASVVMGLAVDNTFHVLRAARGGGARARLAALDAVGGAALASTLALAVGFAALAASDFAPTARFGGLTALGVLAAFVGDFLVLPALWIGTRPPDRRRGPVTLAAAQPRGEAA
jgi:predicted RND superfamily exporter protein